MTRARRLATDVLVIGAGGAGMYAAIEAARNDAEVLLADRSLIGRGGATVMAQMTVAGAPGGADIPRHVADTLAAGRDLCDPHLVELLCAEAPEVIAEMDAWGVGWARQDGALRYVDAPGHSRSRCVYVEFLATGTASSRTLRTQLIRESRVKRVGELMILELLVHDGECVGALGLHVPTGELLAIAAKAVVLATGGLTRLYARNSASANMGGDGYALALRAGAALTDMEFVQFFPIGHLAPRLVGMDPIMWDAFRYKLGGRLLNGEMQEFVHQYGEPTDTYTLTRDQATYAIVKEVEAGRGSPHGGAWLSFEHVDPAALRREFGPIIDRLAKNGIDLRQQPVEVAPIAHYHMGGVRVDTNMVTSVPGLLAAGEAVGGANGANRLSGNAMTEALVFGRRAGRTAAARARTLRGHADLPASSLVAPWARAERASDLNPAAGIAELQQQMAAQVGPFRTGPKLAAAIGRIAALRAEVESQIPRAGTPAPGDPLLFDWLDLRGMLLTAESVARAALAREESRGAHQREDFPAMRDAWRVNQLVTLRGGTLELERAAAKAPAKAAA